MTILGTDYKDFLFGTKGADIFDGGKDADTMTGFGGNDTYYVDDAGDKVVEETNGGVDTVISSVDYHFDANVEKAILTGMAKDAFGNALDNTITGDDQNNTIFGGAGKDTMIGGKGDDFYYVDNSGDKVVETLTQAQGGGYDVVASMVGFSIANTANVEEVILQGATTSARPATPATTGCTAMPETTPSPAAPETTRCSAMRAKTCSTAAPATTR